MSCMTDLYTYYQDRDHSWSLNFNIFLNLLCIPIVSCPFSVFYFFPTRDVCPIDFIDLEDVVRVDRQVAVYMGLRPKAFMLCENSSRERGVRGKLE